MADPVTLTFEERFWSKVNKSDGCWIWTGCLGSGYGQVMDQKIHLLAHRVAYQFLVGEIPHGKHIDHLCRNRSCVNPAHLEPVTVTENILRGVGAPAVNARKTHCKRGHPLSGENLMFLSSGRRKCRICNMAWKAARSSHEA